MTMTVDQYRANLKWLEQQKKKYPFECRTKVKWPRPEEVERLLHGLNIVCVPLMKERAWLFSTAEEMARFKMNYTTLDNKS